MENSYHSVQKCIDFAIPIFPHLILFIILRRQNKKTFTRFLGDILIVVMKPKKLNQSQRTTLAEYIQLHAYTYTRTLAHTPTHAHTTLSSEFEYNSKARVATHF